MSASGLALRAPVLREVGTFVRGISMVTSLGLPLGGGGGGGDISLELVGFSLWNPSFENLLGDLGDLKDISVRKIVNVQSRASHRVDRESGKRWCKLTLDAMQLLNAGDPLKHSTDLDTTKVRLLYTLKCL